MFCSLISLNNVCCEKVGISLPRSVSNEAMKTKFLLPGISVALSLALGITRAIKLFPLLVGRGTIYEGGAFDSGVVFKLIP